MGRFRRGWLLFKYSIFILNKDKELLLYPLMSYVTILVFTLIFYASVFLLPLLFSVLMAFETQVFIFLAAIILVFLNGFIIIFFNAALTSAVLLRLKGQNPNLRDGLRGAYKFKWQIFKYSIVHMTVGIIIEIIAGTLKKVPLLHYIVYQIGITSWSLITYFVIPLLVTQEDCAPFDAIKKSVNILKRTWGEALVPIGGLGLIFFIIYAVYSLGFYVSILALEETTRGPLHNASIESVVITLITFSIILYIIFVFQTTLGAILKACLYQYALDKEKNESPSAFKDDPVISQIFEKGFTKS